MAYPDEEKTELRGSVESVTFRNEENGFTVLDLNVQGELETVVGVLPAVAPGEELRLLGRWDMHASFGRQFRVYHNIPSSGDDSTKKSCYAVRTSVRHYSDGSVICGRGSG